MRAVVLRILLINDNHTISGGTEQYFFDLKKRLKNIPNLEIHSLGFGEKESHGEDFTILKKPTSDFAKLIWQIFFNPWMYFKIKNQIKKINPDIIHLHNIRQYTASILAAVKDYPTVQTIHDYGAVCPIAYNIHKDLQPCETGMRASCFWQHQLKYNPLTYLALSLSFFFTRLRTKKTVKTFFVPSPLQVEYLKKNGYQPAIYIAPFKNSPQSPTFDKIDPNHFLFAGNLGAHKGINILLTEFALAHQKNPNITLTIAGKGHAENQMRKRIHELQLDDQINFAGWQKNLDEEYEKSAAIIFPSLWMEAFGLVITEAMHHARPVIGSNRGSPPWIIDDRETGFIFDPLNNGDLAAKILLLAGNIELITHLGRNAQEKLGTFIDNEKTLQQIIDIYQKVGGINNH